MAYIADVGSPSLVRPGRSETPSRRSRFACLIVATMLLGLSGCSSDLGLPSPGTRQGENISDLWRVFFWAAVAVAAVVYGLIGWSVLRYRARGRTDLPRQVGTNARLEALYIAIPVLLVSALFVLTVRAETNVERLSATPDVRIQVTGFTWSWRFDYPRENVSVVGTPDAPPEMVVPVRRTIRIHLLSDDVIHSFYVPGFLFKRDMIPGVENVFDIEVPLPGVWGGRCAEFCSIGHAKMTFTLRSVSDEEFRNWLANQRARSEAAS